MLTPKWPAYSVEVANQNLLNEASVLRTNVDDLVTMAVVGTVSQPTLRQPGYISDNEGRSVILPGMSGIVYNVRTADPAFGWEADYVEPGVSIAATPEGADFALHYLTCIGNEAVSTSDLAAGRRGILTGEHACMLIDFEAAVYDGLSVGDSIQIIAQGRGLALPDYPRIELKKMSPRHGWLAGCVHPCTSIAFPSEVGNRGLNIFACVGDQATVMSGEVQGSKGVVTGKSGRFSEHVIMHFSKADWLPFAIHDKVVIRSRSVGMSLLAYGKSFTSFALID